MRRFPLQLAALAALLVGVNALIGALLPFAWGDARLDAKLGHLREHADHYDLVALGSSWTYRHLAPAVLDAELERLGPDMAGYSTFNTAIDGVHLPFQGRILEHLIVEQGLRPRVVLLELARFTSAVDRELDHQREANFWRTAPLTASMMRFLAHRHDKSLPQKAVQAVLLSLVQVESWLHIGHGTGLASYMAGVDREPGVLGPGKDGFYPVDQQALDATGRPLENRFLRNPEAQEILDQLHRSCTEAFDAALETPNPEGLRVVDDLLELAGDHGIHLVFVVPPRICQRYPQIRPLLEHIPAAHRIAELADPEHYPDLYRLDESTDRTHFNRAGAERYTRHLAHELARRLALAAQR